MNRLLLLAALLAPAAALAQPYVMLRPAGVEPLDRFATAMSAADEYIAVGAPGDNDRRPNGGAIHVYQRNGGAWTEQKIRSLGYTLLGNDVAIGSSRMISSNFRPPDAQLPSGQANSVRCTFSALQDCASGGDSGPGNNLYCIDTRFGLSIHTSTAINPITGTIRYDLFIYRNIAYRSLTSAPAAGVTDQGFGIALDNGRAVLTSTSNNGLGFEASTYDIDANGIFRLADVMGFPPGYMPAAGDSLGSQVSADSGRLALYDDRRDDRVYLYARGDDAWTYTGRIDLPAAQGTPVTGPPPGGIRPDLVVLRGDTLVVGRRATRHEALVYVRRAGTANEWVLTARLRPPGSVAAGTNVALGSGFVAISDPGDAVTPGAVYVYETSLVTAGEGAPEAAASGVRAWPSPARAGGTVTVEAGGAGAWRASVVDVLGREVAVAGSGEGAARVSWAVPADLSPGVYAVRVARGASVQAARLVVVR